ncbi:uncharacterized protein PODANS_1_17553 [Podospora anserina S mat+]|uniref:Podospora anserina S mat+ genomic DNA chromosome 1, supercontig 4 n=1 Tax=Podospora anserina (strain S / ATCC MYA-4624 / DSM 980 / FGSC 10383) TaxID=515849 RepID=B2AU03_PODAN|nr:uncharacterized protein PODANS_1_17553 [Podospora anserina S mat+]CAP67876.1 unnamed protein product [Podospora anserina S mat+]CDP24135.1 Putative protein of unknown function [Podospora anserina S mat+]
MSKKKMVMEEEPANCLSLPGEFAQVRPELRPVQLRPARRRLRIIANSQRSRLLSGSAPAGAELDGSSGFQYLSNLRESRRDDVELIEGPGQPYSVPGTETHD